MMIRGQSSKKGSMEHFIWARLKLARCSGLGTLQVVGQGDQISA